MCYDRHLELAADTKYNEHMIQTSSPASSSSQQTSDLAIQRRDAEHEGGTEDASQLDWPQFRTLTLALCFSKTIAVVRTPAETLLHHSISSSLSAADNKMP